MRLDKRLVSASCDRWLVDEGIKGNDFIVSDADAVIGKMLAATMGVATMGSIID